MFPPLFLYRVFCSIPFLLHINTQFPAVFSYTFLLLTIFSIRSNVRANYLYIHQILLYWFQILLLLTLLHLISSDSFHIFLSFPLQHIFLFKVFLLTEHISTTNDFPTSSFTDYFYLQYISAESCSLFFLPSLFSFRLFFSSWSLRLHCTLFLNRHSPDSFNIFFLKYLPCTI